MDRHKTVYNRFNRWSARGIWQKIFETAARTSRSRRERSGPRQHACQSASLRWRRKRGASEQAIGITKGGRNSKIHGACR